MLLRAPWCVVAVLFGTAGSAHALKPGTHADLAKQSCLAEGLPSSFCQRLATEDYNTDSREWEDLRAHAQIDAGETACVAADRTAARLWQLGSDLRQHLASVRARATDTNVGLAATAVGRALHTIQDNCAHRGMPNPQHAWFSLSDFCLGTELSPDIQADALRCARSETDAVMQLISDAVRDSGTSSALAAESCPPAPSTGPRDTQEQPICQQRFLPGPIDACRFLGGAKDWDGIDRTWANVVVAGALHQAFAAGLAGAPNLDSVCGGDESVLSSAVSQPMLDVSGGAPTCSKAKLLCLGKADDAENPFFDHDHDGVTEDESTGGCSTGGGGGGALVVFAGLLISRRRRAAR